MLPLLQPSSFATRQRGLFASLDLGMFSEECLQAQGMLSHLYLFTVASLHAGTEYTKRGI